MEDTQPEPLISSQTIEKKPKYIWLNLIIALAVGILIGQLFGYWRAYNFFEGVTEIKEYKFNHIIAQMDGDTYFLIQLNESYACATFDMNDEQTLDYYNNILRKAYLGQPTCFKGG